MFGFSFPLFRSDMIMIVERNNILLKSNDGDNGNTKPKIFALRNKNNIPKDSFNKPQIPNTRINFMPLVKNIIIP
jgi:hypothetical protein